MVNIQLLGRVRIETGGTDSAGAPQQAKRLALIGYLAVARPRGGHRRDALLAMFWPDLDEERARSALRQALHGIRRSMGPETIATAGIETIALDSAHVRCDVWDLEGAATAGDHDRVLARYEGELLRGLHVADAPSFGHWLDTERMRINSLVRTSAWAGADAAATKGKTDDVVRWAGLALSLSELDEEAARRAMRLIARTGQRAQALAVYERFAEHLRAELEVEPTEETRMLAEDIRRTEVRSAVPVVPVPEPVVQHIDETPRTVHYRAPRRRWIVAACLAVTAIAAAAQLAPRTPRFDRRQLRVEVFRSAVTDSSVTMARTLTRDVGESLSRIDNVQVVASEVGDDALEMFERSPRQAYDDRAGTIVRGSLRPHHDSVEVHAEIVDRESGLLLGAVKLNIAPGNPGRFVERLQVAVATALYPGWGSALSQPLSYQSYQLMVDGLRSIKREAHTDALAAFSRAYAEDSAFTAAGLLAAMELYQLRRFSTADSVARRIAAHRAELRPIDARLLDWITYSLHGDRNGARTAMSRVTELAPNAELAWLQLAIDNVETARPAEALDALSHIDASSEFGEAWPSYWATRIEALHIMRDHDRELVVTRAALRQHPEVSILVSYETRSLAALGRVAELMRTIQNVAALPAGRGIDVPTTMRQAGLELRAHGYTAAADTVLALAQRWYELRPPAERSSANWRSGYARTLYLRRRDAGARAIYDSLAHEVPSCFDCVGIAGVIAARQGDTVAARTAEEALSAIEKPFLFGRPLLWRARIAAARGDSARATSLLTAAFASGAEFDVMTHADIELSRLEPDKVYLSFARRN